MHVPQTELVAMLQGRELLRRTLPPGDYLIGRDDDVPVRIDAKAVSNRHARLVLNFDEWFVEDLGSLNGTTVGGQKIDGRAEVFPHQELRVGNVAVQLRRLPYHGTETTLPVSRIVTKMLPAVVPGTGRYLLGRLIGKGGMGSVVEARDTITLRTVAMKILGTLQTTEYTARFIEEAQVTAQLDHPNIVPVYDIGVNELGRPYFTMQLVRGHPLEDILSNLKAGDHATLDRWKLPALLAAFERACDAVLFAHACSVIHRDLKPGNILLGKFGEVLVMDWGLAKVLDSRFREGGEHTKRGRSRVRSVRSETAGYEITEPGAVIGTPRFMSPEQAEGRSHEADPLTDVFLLGAVLYAILTLESPVAGEDANALIDNAAAGRIRPPAETVAGRSLPHLPGGKLPEALAAVAMKALAKNPRNRFADVRALKAAVAGAAVAR